MSPTDIPQHRLAGLSGVRWALIGLCAALIYFSDQMAGRLGFAVLLGLAVIVGWFAGRRHVRLPQAPEHAEPGLPVPRQPGAADTPTQRREAGR